MKGFKLSIAAILFAAISFGQSGEPILLYPNGVPNSKPAPNYYF
jgi:hypothetical protein